jgi:hypothetical protein
MDAVFQTPRLDHLQTRALKINLKVMLPWRLIHYHLARSLKSGHLGNRAPALAAHFSRSVWTKFPYRNRCYDVFHVLPWHQNPPQGNATMAFVPLPSSGTIKSCNLGNRAPTMSAHFAVRMKFPYRSIQHYLKVDFCL